MGCLPTPKPAEKITVVYELLYSTAMPDFVTDEPPYGYESEPPKPAAYLVHGKLTLEDNEMLLTLTSKPPHILTDSKFSAPAYAVKTIDKSLFPLIKHDLRRQEGLADKMPIFFSPAKANVVLTENVKTLEIILEP